MTRIISPLLCLCRYKDIFPWEVDAIEEKAETDTKTDSETMGQSSY